MNEKILLLTIVVLSAIHFVHVSHSESCTFPDHFEFGAATSAYQIEGAVSTDGRGESIWDNLVRNHPDLIRGRSTADVACDSYTQWKTDVNMVSDLGVTFYRFSISWTRILPTGFSSHINYAGVVYYNRLIDELLSRNIQPMVTLYHWDLPQTIQDLGGWTNFKTADYFADYARVIFELFGNRVKYWVTINEPFRICHDAYEINEVAPPIQVKGIGLYLCGKTILLAHAKAYRLYNNLFRDKQKGLIGITIDMVWMESMSQNQLEINAAERYMQMQFGWFAHPIFSSDGNYPQVMIDRIAYRSHNQNFSESRLPPFSPDELEMVKGSADFLGLNHYFTQFVSPFQKIEIVDDEYRNFEVSYAGDSAVTTERKPGYPFGEYLPWGIRRCLNWIKREYGNPLVFVTENGYGDTDDSLNDTLRTEKLQGFLFETCKAAMEDGCNVSKYAVWSLMDNWEWRNGYTVKFGIYRVDFNSRNRTRTPKRSAKCYKSVTRNRRVCLQKIGSL